MVNFGPPDTVPEKFRGRNFYQHNPQVTLMRTTPEECAQLGRIIAEKLNRSNGPLTVLVPQKAISVISAPGQKFHDPSADKALFDGLKTDPEVSVPTLAAQKLAAVPAPELEPPVFSAARPSNVASRGSFRGSYGLRPCPLTAL